MLPLTRSQLSDKVKSLESEVELLEQSLGENQAALTTKQEEAANASQELASTREQLEEATAELASCNETLVETQEALSQANDKLATFDTEVETVAKAKANAYLEKLGHSPLDLEQSKDDPTEPAEKSILEQFESITDPKESYEFAKAHAAEIEAAMFAN